MLLLTRGTSWKITLRYISAWPSPAQPSRGTIQFRLRCVNHQAAGGAPRQHQTGYNSEIVNRGGSGP